MHELAVTENILDIAIRHASKAGADRITDIDIVIGNLSSIIDDSVSFYWDIISKDTIAQGAQLHFKRLPTLIQCLDCLIQFQPEGEFVCCPSCKSQKIRVVQGKEFFLESIQIESKTNA